MLRLSRAFVISTFFIIGLALPSGAEQVGLLPIPVLENVKVEAGVSFDSTTGLYNYSYTITNPGSNTGEIGRFVVDVKRPSSGLLLSSEGLTFSFFSTTQTFDEFYQEFNKGSAHIVPFGVHNPSGWIGSPQMYIHAASFGGMTEESLIQPGSALSGFEIISRGLPAIREVTIDPAWVFMVDDLEAVTPEEEKRAHEIPGEIQYHMKSIGPTAPQVDMNGNFLPGRLLLDIGNYVYEARNLGWITDTALYDKLLAKYMEAKQAGDVHNYNPGQVIVAMGEFIDILNSSTAAQRTNEGYGLLYYNAKYLVDHMP